MSLNKGFLKNIQSEMTVPPKPMDALEKGKPMEYRQTLNLPKTDFPMKANLAKREPETLKEWEANKLYHQLCEQTKGRPRYILHDGPPYANGHIHIGTALNKILKDFIVKSKSMVGFASPYVPGWDCHGLPVEHEVEKSLGSKKGGSPLLRSANDAAITRQNLWTFRGRSSSDWVSLASGRTLISP